MTYLVFDIETRPHPQRETIADAIKWRPDARAKDAEASAAKKRDAFLESAALHAAVSQVLAIGYWDSDSDEIWSIAGDDEQVIVSKFWDVISKYARQKATFVGFNSNSFDVPYLIRRSLVHGIDVPDGVLTDAGYLSFWFVDLKAKWDMPRLYTPERSASLDLLAAVFNLPVRKLEGVTGDQFWQLWDSDRAKAYEYLRRDVATTVHLGKAMGVIQ